MRMNLIESSIIIIAAIQVAIIAIPNAAFGTTIVCIRTPEVIVFAADSKRIYEDSNQRTVKSSTVCKIFYINNSGLMKKLIFLNGKSLSRICILTKGVLK